MPGMFCRVSIDLGGRDDALLVPLGALIGRSKGTSRSSVVGKQRGDSAVFIVREGKANRVAIKLGVERGGYGEVLDGLAEGDQVVTEGQVALQDGRAVRVIKAKKRD